MEVLIGLGIGIAVGVIGTVEWALCAAKKYEPGKKEDQKDAGSGTG